MSEDEGKINNKHNELESSLTEYHLVPVGKHYSEGTYSDLTDFVALVQTIWKNRKDVYKAIGIFVLIGLLIAFLSPAEYETQATLMPELSDQGSLSGAGSLLQKYGGLLGINSSGLIGSNPSDINVMLYPNIVQSTPFMLELMNQKIHSDQYDTTVSVFTYFNDFYTPGIFGYVFKFTIGLPGLIKNGFSEKQQITTKTDSGVVEITQNQEEVIKKLNDRLTTNVDNESGVISITSEMPEAGMSAVVANKTIELLKSYITEYRTQKALRDYKFINGQYKIAKERFQKAQDTLAKFQDQNLSLSTAQSQTQLKRLQDEYNLTYNLYTGLAQQLEQARIQVQQNTPVFKVMEPATIPLEKSSPKKIIILMISLILGLIVGIGLVFLKKRFLYLKKIWNKN